MEQVVVFNKLSVQNSNHTYKRSSRNACKQALHTLHRCNRKSCQMYFLNLHQVYSSQHSGPIRSTHRNYGKYSSNLKKTVPLEMTTKLACFLGWIEPAYLNQNYAVPLFLIIQANVRCLMPGIICILYP